MNRKWLRKGISFNTKDYQQLHQEFWHLLLLKDGLSQEAFLTYVTEVLLPELWPGSCVVMDNLPAHKATKVRELIESVGAKVVFLSPYSPDFNQA